MKHKTVCTVALLATLMLVAAGCWNPTGAERQTGSEPGSAEHGLVVMQFNDLRALTITPEISLEIDSYEVSFTRSGFQPVTLSGVPGDAAQSEPVRLRPGPWQVTVNAVNDEGKIIGLASAAVTVVARQTVTSSVSIRSLTGEGTLSLTADVSELELLSPSISGTLSSGATGEASGVSMSINGSSGSFEQTLEAGTYLLSLQLFESDTPIAGFVNTVLIVYQEITSAALVFRPVSGSVVVELADEITRPIAVTLEGLQESLGPEESMTVSAQTAVAVDSYQWYLDGYAIPGETGQQITLGPGLDEGEYLLTVVVKRGEIYSAEARGFSVVPDIAEDPVGFSFAESVVIEFTIENWWYADYSSVLEVAFLHDGEVLFSHDAGIENAVEDPGWVFSYGYVFAYADEAGSFTLLEVPPLADVTEVRIVIDDHTSGTFVYQFFLESLEGQTFAVSASQGNEIFVLTPEK
ncbi:MAG: hypothetical protein EA404_15070 [Spirochaetaceae bacterium]|nr:MAG: hypothetical protein EA404_15070 [Spirochaetaceae bacterium]